MIDIVVVEGINIGLNLCNRKTEEIILSKKQPKC